MVDEEGKPYSLKPKQQCCGAIDVLPLPLFHAVVSFICTAYTSRWDYATTSLRLFLKHLQKTIEHTHTIQSFFVFVFRRLRLSCWWECPPIAISKTNEKWVLNPILEKGMWREAHDNAGEGYRGGACVGDAV